MTMLSGLRDASWLNAQRAQAYGVILAAFLALAGGITIHASWRQAARAPGHLPTATDFLPFYSAGRLARAGQAPDAYRLDRLTPAERQDAMLAGGQLPFMYPPIFLLLCAALAGLPYGMAWLAFQALGVVPLVLALRRLLPQRWAWLPLLSAPAILINAGSGQTGAHTAACFARAAVLADRRPIAAGGALGLLAFKPHLALLVPLALLLARRWRMLVACGATATGLYLLSWVVLGTPTWAAFFAQAPLSREILEHWSQSRFLISVFGAVRLAGAGLPLAYALQALCAVLAAGLMCATGWRRPGGAAEISVLAAAALFATPYGMDYDLPDLLLPAAWILARAQRDGWRPWEKLTLCASFVLPMLVRLMVLVAHVQIAPPILAALLVLAARRARRPLDSGVAG